MPSYKAPQPRVLVVDDDNLIRASLAIGLRKAGYEIVEASCGDDALQVIAESAPALAILDVSMPGMTGFELARRMRETCTMPILFLSSNNDEDSFREARECGSTAYFVKPVLPAQLVPAIESSLARMNELRKLNESTELLTTALTSGRQTNMAIGIIMERYRMNRDDAFEFLRSQARAQRRKVDSVAAEFLCAAEAHNKAN